MPRYQRKLSSKPWVHLIQGVLKRGKGVYLERGGKKKSARSSWPWRLACGKDADSESQGKSGFALNKGMCTQRRHVVLWFQLPVVGWFVKFVRVWKRIGLPRALGLSNGPGVASTHALGVPSSRLDTAGHLPQSLSTRRKLQVEVTWPSYRTTKWMSLQLVGMERERKRERSNAWLLFRTELETGWCYCLDIDTCRKLTSGVLSSRLSKNGQSWSMTSCAESRSPAQTSWLLNSVLSSCVLFLMRRWSRLFVFLNHHSQHLEGE